MAIPLFHLGLDLGSISLKAALLTPTGEVVFSRWMRVAGTPLDAFARLQGELQSFCPDAQFASIGITGSGREMLCEILGGVVINEITAQAAACAALHPHVGTIIEIGGQDSKLIVFDTPGHQSPVTGHGISHFAMNELCAAGTGAFLDQQAARLKVPIEAFARLALDATDPVPIAGRCAVFAKTDMTHHQQEGRPLPDIVAGLNEALVRSYLSNMVRGKELPRPISFQGGVASNAGLVQAFKKILALGDEELIVPEHHRVMGAIGAAIVASRQRKNGNAGMHSSLRLAASDAGGSPAAKDAGLHTATETGVLRRRSECIPAFPNSSSHLTRLVPSPCEPMQPHFDRLRIDGAYLGIDVGSVSVKAVVLSPDGIAFEDYRFSDGRPIEVLRQMLSDLEGKVGRFAPAGVGVTGSGRHFIGGLLGADTVVNEITAQARAAAELLPKTDTVIEVGGQDAKFMRLSGTRATHFSMNRVCAAGTGAFLQEQAERLRVGLDGEFAREAFASRSPAELGSRCTVFMESDLVAHQQQGFARSDLIAGLARSVVANYLEKVVAGHPMGERVLFLGGVADNRAVVAALEEILSRPVATTTAGKISGAIGAAIVAFEARRAKRYTKSAFRCDAARLDYDGFLCEECPNRCRVTRTRTEPPRTFGGRCGKWDGIAKRRPSARSLLQFRLQLLQQEIPPEGASTTTHRERRLSEPDSAASDEPASEAQASERRLSERAVAKDASSSTPLRIGIPRALFAFDRLPAWKTFFEEAGCEVVLSPPTDADLLTEGMKHLVVENCLPAKAFCAHVHWLSLQSDIDAIFVPSLVATGEDRHRKETVHCPYVQGLSTLAHPVAQKPLIAPAINWRLHPDDERRAMIGLASGLGIARRRAANAWKKATAAQQAFRRELRRTGDRLLADLGARKIPRAFVIMGKDYNVGDPSLNSRAIETLESMGEVCCTQDMLADDGGHYDPAYRTMYWSHGKEILAAAEIVARTPDLYPIYITSFGCGPDSFTIRATRDILGEKPLLLLEVDEHSSAVGMETRIEAFLDSLAPSAEENTQRPRRRPPASQTIRRVFLPNFSDHGYAFAAAIRALGFLPALTAIPDDAAGRLGAKYATTGECHPYTLMFGSYLQTAQREQGASDACYFMPESGSCRVGLFGLQMRLASEEAGAHLPIVTQIQELSSSIAHRSRRSYAKALITYWEMMRGMDFALQKFYETRAYEVTPGSAERAREEGRRALMPCIMAGRPIEGLRIYHDLLNAVKTDRTERRIRIGITGDYFTRICDSANGDIFRDIEQLGGVVMLPPTMSEFVKYDAHQKPIAMLHHGRLADFLQALFVRGVVDRRERRVRSLFSGSIDYDIPLEYSRATKLIAPYMDAKLPAGLAGSVAAVLEQIHAGADGILNLITFHCTYGLVLSSALASISRDHPEVPTLTLIFEGLKPTHNRTRLEAFMERVREALHRRGGRGVSSLRLAASDAGGSPASKGAGRSCGC